jgi:hypothetical protein
MHTCAKKEEKVGRFLVLDLTFSQHEVKLSVDSGSVASGSSVPGSLHRFQQKVMKTDQVKKLFCY